jgi:hypothetical protein
LQQIEFHIQSLYLSDVCPCLSLSLKSAAQTYGQSAMPKTARAIQSKKAPSNVKIERNSLSPGYTCSKCPSYARYAKMADCPRVSDDSRWGAKSEQVKTKIYNSGLERYSGTTPLVCDFSAWFSLSSSLLTLSSCSTSHFSASSAAMQPEPALVMACRYLLS